MSSVRKTRAPQSRDEDEDTVPMFTESAASDSDHMIDISTDHLQVHTQSHDDEEVWLVSYADLMTLLVAFFALLLSFSKIDPNQFEKVKEEATKAFGGEYQIPFQDLAKSLRETLRDNGLTDKVFVEQTAEGVLIHFKGNLLFASGEAALLKSAEKLIEQVIPHVSANLSQFDVEIEGHTDSKSIQAGLIKSNWELSGLRAAAVARKFLQEGVPAERLRILGYADTRPINEKILPPNIDPQTKNALSRRVVIRLTKKY